MATRGAVHSLTVFKSLRSFENGSKSFMGKSLSVMRLTWRAAELFPFSTLAELKAKADQLYHGTCWLRWLYSSRDAVKLQEIQHGVATAREYFKVRNELRTGDVTSYGVIVRVSSGYRSLNRRHAREAREY